MLGPNGAGKTTTLRMILDILKPDRARSPCSAGPSRFRQDRIGYLPEERGLYRDVPVLQVLTYLGQLKGMSQGEAERRATELLHHVDLGDNVKSKVSELSKGMQQKVQIVATILHHPDLIIVDEPFAGLDPVNTQVIKDLLYEMNRRNDRLSCPRTRCTRSKRWRTASDDRSRAPRPVRQRQEVRDRFAQNAVIVEGQGDWAARAGVTAVEVRR